MTIDQNLLTPLSKKETVQQLFMLGYMSEPNHSGSEEESIQAVERDAINRGGYFFRNKICLFIKTKRPLLEFKEKSRDYRMQVLLKELDANLIKQGEVAPVGMHKDFLNAYLHQSAIGGLFARILRVHVKEASNNNMDLCGFNGSIILECAKDGIYIKEKLSCYGVHSEENGSRKEKHPITAKLIYKISFFKTPTGEWRPQMEVQHLAVDCNKNSRFSCYFYSCTLWERIQDALRDILDGVREFLNISRDIQNPHRFFPDSPPWTKDNSILDLEKEEPLQEEGSSSLHMVSSG